jgi:hypothetical protein
MNPTLSGRAWPRFAKHLVAPTQSRGAVYPPTYFASDIGMLGLAGLTVTF